MCRHHSRVSCGSAVLESPLLLIQSHVNARPGPDERRYAIPEMLECRLWRQDRTSAYDEPQINSHIPRHFPHHVRQRPPLARLKPTISKRNCLSRPVISIAITGVNRTQRRVTSIVGTSFCSRNRAARLKKEMVSILLER